MMKKALITGITGQDGSYLAELLLDKGYEVHGIIRRASTFNTERIEHIYQDPHERKKRLILHYGDLSDASNISRLLDKIKPDEIYHLGAQSHVQVSFDIPEYTANVTGLGTLRILDAIKDSGLKTKFYQASSSELFGLVQEVPQKETTPFYPRSPYGCAKVFAYWISVNYRESYNLFVSNGILFNHETIAAFMPMFYKKKTEDEFDIKPISEIAPFDESRREYQAREVSDLCVWGKDGWVDVKHASAYPHNIEDDNKQPCFINARSGAFLATASHVGFMEDGEEKEVGEMMIGDNLETIDLPSASIEKSVMSPEEAELLGMMVGDGSITRIPKKMSVHGKFTNSSLIVRQRFDLLWINVTGGHTKYYPSRSGFNPDKIVGQLSLAGGSDWLREADIYNQDKTKRVPRAILNADKKTMSAFLRGYNVTDGLKSNPCTYEFRNFKTNSATLAMGLWYLIEQTTRQDINLTVETKEDGRLFYSLNILSTVDNLAKENVVRELTLAQVSQRGISRQTEISRTFIRKIQQGGVSCQAHHFRKKSAEIKKIIDMPNYSGWFYDLETSSGEFHCGVGKAHVHNSPRRGKTFVTRKITRGLVRVKLGVDERLYLGNLEAKRDWGYAKDYVEAMWQMLQQEKPGDYVIATGEAHSIREFVEETCQHLDFDLVWEGKGVTEKGIDRKSGKTIISIDPRYFRPAEVDLLIGDSRKAKKELGWKAKTTFKQLVKIMVEADLAVETKLKKLGEQ